MTCNLERKREGGGKVSIGAGGLPVKWTEGGREGKRARRKCVF